MTTILDTLRALSTDLVTVTAIERDGQIVASYHVDGDDLDAAESIGAQVSREIGEAMRRDGWRFVDAGGDDPGIYEIWAQPEAEYHLHHAGHPIHGDANAYHMGDSDPVAFADLDDAIKAAQDLDETCGWDVDVVEVLGLNRRIAWGH